MLMENLLIGRGKLILAYTAIGIIFGVVAVGIMNLIAGIFSITFGTDLANVFSMLFNIAEPLGILFAIINVIVIGVLVWIFGMIGAYIKAKVMSEKAVITKRPHVFSFLLLGIVTIVVIGAYNSVLVGISPEADLTDINTLFGEQGIVAMIGSILAYSGLGFVVVLLGSKGVKLAEDKTPDKLQKF